MEKVVKLQVDVPKEDEEIAYEIIPLLNAKYETYAPRRKE